MFKLDIIIYKLATSQILHEMLSTFCKIPKINKSNIALNNKVQRGVWFLGDVLNTEGQQKEKLLAKTEKCYS